MNEQSDLREQQLTQLSRLEMIDMTVQSNVINKCVYEMIRNKEFLSLDTLVAKCNQYYIVQDRARYGKRRLKKNHQSLARQEWYGLAGAFIIWRCP
ncbi:MAG TPA: hypothetical protein VJZ49_06300 [Syntrophales bacterium]|nr:hypothetical protein [Syntrophales bacterium]